ncbi:4Fe-4S dicluster domain-containing protein [Geobacter pickeringii]|uniref:4Fe-4S dicluster domain-containing protein n=1 Tax=Geobacter pickeringii TaxID=345632 RepID=UPI00068AF3FA|nr:4Fe-4S dicluster domain-containing protein [Geobacter pickeringii]
MAGCAGCTACRDACPSGIIVRHDGIDGPLLDFGAGCCTFCSRCAEACPRGVLAPSAPGERAPLGTATVDQGRCLVRGGCFACSERCPEGAITPRAGSEIRVSTPRCSGCGACEHVCPVEPKAMCVVPVCGTV